MRAFSLTCSNCTAPLEAPEAAEELKCAYCGSPQVLARSADEEPLDEVEATHDAIRREDARRDAEREIDRLTEEREEVMEKKKTVAAEHAQKRAGERKRRLQLAGAAFVATWLGGGAVMSVVDRQSIIATPLTLAWLVAIFGVPVYVYRKTGQPDPGTADELAWCDRRLAHIDRRLTEYRVMADKLTY